MKPDKIEIAKLATLVQESSASAILYLHGLQDRSQEMRHSASANSESHFRQHLYASVASVSCFMAGAITLVDNNPVVSAVLTSGCLLGLGKAVYHALAERKIMKDARLEKGPEQLIAEDVAANISARSLWDQAMVNLGGRNDEIQGQVRDVTTRLRQEPQDEKRERMRMV